MASEASLSSSESSARGEEKLNQEENSINLESDGAIGRARTKSADKDNTRSFPIQFNIELFEHINR